MTNFTKGEKFIQDSPYTRNKCLVLNKTKNLTKKQEKDKHTKDKNKPKEANPEKEVMENLLPKYFKISIRLLKKDRWCEEG